jgi:hypothetical protein
MYGIINKSIEELITSTYGQVLWNSVKERSGIDIDYFLSNEPYDDDITYKLADAAGKVLDISVGQVLEVFGEFWIIKTCKEKYGGLLEAGGATLKEFLINLPIFHNRVMLVYPRLTPPEFKVSNLTDSSIDIHYLSKRPGLQEFVRGLLSGLGKLHSTPIDITLLQSRNDGNTHEIFRVHW